MQTQINNERRNFLRAASALALGALLKGCGTQPSNEPPFQPPSAPPQNPPRDLRLSITNVPGLNTPYEITSRDEVLNVVNQLEIALAENGIDYSPVLYGNYDLSPPNIVGKYDIAGFYLTPEMLELLPGTFNVRSQQNNVVNLDYSQLLDGETVLVGGTNRATIIRGGQDKFTLYAVPRVRTSLSGGCESDAVLIMEGERDDIGIVGVFATTPIGPSCLLTGGGVFDFRYIGPPKEKIADQQARLKEHPLRNYLSQNTERAEGQVGLFSPLVN